MARDSLLPHLLMASSYSVLCQVIPVNVIPSHLPKTHFNIIHLVIYTLKAVALLETSPLKSYMFFSSLNIGTCPVHFNILGFITLQRLMAHALSE
jgi:hypothetical protein